MVFVVVVKWAESVLLCDDVMHAHNQLNRWHSVTVIIILLCIGMPSYNKRTKCAFENENEIYIRVEQFSRNCWFFLTFCVPNYASTHFKVFAIKLKALKIFITSLCNLLNSGFNAFLDYFSKIWMHYGCWKLILKKI